MRVRQILLAATMAAVGVVGIQVPAASATDCYGAVNTCSDAGACSGAVNVCAGAESCSGAVNYCNGRVTVLT